MTYRRDDALEAWKTFVNSGVILEDKVRPEIARSWIRCRAAGVNPWSSNFAERNSALLEEKRRHFAASLRATAPMMKFLKAMLGCNISLMDGENFVFELLSPMAAYPRTFGTFMREEDVGTGNATIVAYEKKPVRVDGFEHYRTVAQTYSGVAAPYLDAAGKYYGALNINSPFAFLPECALELCKTGVELSNQLHRAGTRAKALLSTVEYYAPLMLTFGQPVLLMDEQGHILSANGAMRPYCPDWEQYSYGSQSLGSYLGKDCTVQDILDLPEHPEAPFPIPFGRGRKRGCCTLDLVRHGVVDVEGQDPFVVLVFNQPINERAHVERIEPSRPVEAILRSDAKVDYIGETEEWKQIDRMVQKVAPIKTNVLLLGETGTGKEVVARALHRRSGRSGEFVAVNCGALPRDLLATELFGYEGGAFTGAREGGAVGKFEYANGGTLFLDEIGEMPVDMQVSLLRVLQEQSVTKLGSNTSKALDVRVVAATNQDIERLMKEKKFRSDLYYRLSLVEIRLPQLRHRKNDIPLLVDYFNHHLSEVLNLPCTPFPQRTLNVFRSYSWPGNVRELRNIVERSLIMQGDGANVLPDTLPPYIANAGNAMPSDERDAPDLSGEERGDDSSATAEGPGGEEIKRSIIAVLKRHDGDIEDAAHELGLSPDEFKVLMDRLHLRMRMAIEDLDSAGGGL